MNIHFIHAGLAKNPESLSIYLHYCGISRVKNKPRFSKFAAVHNKEGVLELSSMSNWGIRTLNESHDLGPIYSIHSDWVSQHVKCTVKVCSVTKWPVNQPLPTVIIEEE
jgi:hypothetical protein